MRTRISQKDQASFVRQIIVSSVSVTDITGWKIWIDIKSLDKTKTYENLSTEGATPEIVITTPSPSLTFDITINDIRAWDNDLLIADILVLLPSGYYVQSELLEIDNREGVTKRV